ncbi:hypothetical protein PF010_g27448, partial [Phytophthora fragariae]
MFGTAIAIVSASALSMITMAIAAPNTTPYLPPAPSSHPPCPSPPPCRSPSLSLLHRSLCLRRSSHHHRAIRLRSFVRHHRAVHLRRIHLPHRVARPP